MIEEMLDQLAEFQAQADLLAMKKQELIDAVKVPEEVLAAQENNAKARAALDKAYWSRIDAMKKLVNDAIEAIEEPELPPEYVAAMDRARKKVQEIEKQFDDDAECERQQYLMDLAKMADELQTKTAQVYAQVAQRKAEITAEFMDKEAGVKDNIDKLTGEIKNAVKEAQRTVKGKVYQAVFVRGRVTWNTDMLDGMVIAFPALAKARKVGEPSVTLRKI